VDSLNSTVRISSELRSGLYLYDW